MESMLQTIVNRNLLSWAAGHHIQCKHCGDILDQSRTVIVTAPSGSWVGCAACWGRGPWCMDDGRWSVLDGRVLFAPSKRRRAR